MGFARCGVDFVPPSEPDESSAGDVLEVVEVCGEEEEGNDEDEDAFIFFFSMSALNLQEGRGLGYTYKLLIKSTPKRYINKLPALGQRPKIVQKFERTDPKGEED